MKAVYTFWKGNFSPDQSLWMCTKMSGLLSANPGLFMCPFSSPFHTQCSKTMVPGCPLDVAALPYVQVHEDSFGLILTFCCPWQNTWTDSTAPKTPQPKSTTPNSITVLLITSVEAELVAPAKQDRDCVPTVVFPGNTGTECGWVVKVAAMQEQPGGAQNIAVVVPYGYVRTLEQ